MFNEADRLAAAASGAMAFAVRFCLRDAAYIGMDALAGPTIFVCRTAKEKRFCPPIFVTFFPSRFWFRCSPWAQRRLPHRLQSLGRRRRFRSAFRRLCRT